MAFQSLGFLAFLGATLAVCLLVGRKSARAGEGCLLVASAAFYLLSFSRHLLAGFLVLLLGGLVSRWAVGAMLRVEQQPAAWKDKRRKTALALAVCWHVGVLLVFKYTGFFTGGAVSLGWSPLGLSFFTFQQLWLIKEAYTGEVSPEELRLADAGDFGLLALFFPTLTSGPILRARDFWTQLHGESFLHPNWQDAAAGAYAIALGMGKKVLLADPLGSVVNNGWAHPEALTAPDAWIVILGYTLQLYLDFSGYCDIATGIARLFGICLPVNFHSPYRALSVGEFWKRWHITLTTFLRECVYFPLGGSRKGPARTACNILLVFLISGFWHGAGWTFLIWGALHGVAQILERALGGQIRRLPNWLRWMGTFAFVNAAWVFFRAPNLAAAGTMLRAALFGGIARPEAWLFSGLLPSEQRALALLVPGTAAWMPLALTLVLLFVGLAASLCRENTMRQIENFRPTAFRCIAAVLLLACAILSFSGITTFIYANF